jgi:Na+/proline symporter
MLSKMGILIDEGYSGLWIFYSSVLSVGFIPVIFAPLWSRIKFITDNQFTLLRFSGKSAKILHVFRAAYVGYLVVSIAISLYIIALVKLLGSYLDLEYNQAFIVVAIIALIVIIKNSFAVKIKTDLFNSIVYLFAFVIGSLFVVNYFGGFKEIYSNLNSNYSDYTNLFTNRHNSESISNLIVFFGIQWWSINILDGSGPRAQRFMNVKTGLDAFKTAVFPILLMSFIFIFKSFVLDTGLLVANQSPEIVPIVNGAKDYEGFFISIFTNSLPSGIYALVFIAFFIGLISIFESLLNWGASFISVDIFSTYIRKDSNSKRKVQVSYIIMILIVITALIIAWFNTYLLGIQKFIFSMAAGVGPVFILRWFWKRINAWSQLSAMASSLILTICYDALYKTNDIFSNFIELNLQNFNISYYPFKLIILTFLVTTIWLTVTFLTKPDSSAHINRFYSKLRLTFKTNRKVTIIWKTALIVLLPVITILPFIFVWSFKFYSIILAIALFALWIGLIFIVVMKMKDLYSELE